MATGMGNDRLYCNGLGILDAHTGEVISKQFVYVEPACPSPDGQFVAEIAHHDCVTVRRSKDHSPIWRGIPISRESSMTLAASGQIVHSKESYEDSIAYVVEPRPGAFTTLSRVSSSGKFSHVSRRELNRPFLFSFRLVPFAIADPLMTRRKRSNPVRVRRPRRSMFEQLEARLVLAQLTWDGGGDGLSWRDVRNWSGDVLPGSADRVTINDTQLRVHLEGTAEVQQMEFAAALVLEANSQLTITGAATVTGELSIQANATLQVIGPTANFQALGRHF